MNRTSIEWTHRPETRGAAGGMTWNPIRARLVGTSHKARSGTFCTRISPGCQHCYASTINKRFGNGLEFIVPNLVKIEFFVDERILQEPSKQKKPCTIFVGDMFDLFHEAIPLKYLLQVFGVMSHNSHHTFQILTKRADRMQAILGDMSEYGFACDVNAEWYRLGHTSRWDWPLPNVWLGASVESQKYADERIPLLLQTPAAVRFLSVEPLLEPVSLTCVGTAADHRDVLCGGPCGVHWVICGGESGPGARPFNLAWAESLLAQCRAAHVPFFMKQVGSYCIFRDQVPEDAMKFPLDTDEQIDKAAHALGKELNNWHRLTLRDRKGGDPSEWPEALRVREFPSVATREAVTA